MKITENFQKNTKMPKFLAIFFSEYYSYFVLFIFALALIFSYFFVLKPNFNDISEERLSLNILEEKKQNNIRVNILSLERYKKSYENIDWTDKEKIINIIPNKSNIEEFFPWMEKIIEGEIIDGKIYGGMGFLLDSISINDTGVSNIDQDENEDNFQKSIRENIGIINIDISVSGVDYDSLKDLLAKLENNLKLMDVQSISFSENSVGLSINTYYLKNPDLIIKGVESGNKREVLNLGVFNSKKFKNLKKIDVKLDDLNNLEIGNKYPFGLNSKKNNLENEDKSQELIEINNDIEETNEINEVDEIDEISSIIN